MARREKNAVNELLARASGGQVRIANARPPAMKANVPPDDDDASMEPEWMNATIPARPAAMAFETRAWSPPTPGAASVRPPRPQRGHDEKLVGTRKMRHSALRTVGTVVLPMVLLVIAGIAIGGYVVSNVQGTHPGDQMLTASAAAPSPARAEPSAPKGLTPAPVPGAAPAATSGPAVAVPGPAHVPVPVQAQPGSAPAAPAAPVPGAPMPGAPMPAANAVPASAVPMLTASAVPAPAVPMPAAPIPAAPIPAAQLEQPPAATPVPSDRGGSEPPAPEAVARTSGRTSGLVDVRIDSTPSGAQVTLVDRGKSQFVGSTPLNTMLDPSRRYDLVFVHPSKPTRVEHVDPGKTRHVAVVLGRASGAKPTDRRRHTSRVRTEPAPVASVEKPTRAEDEPVPDQGTVEKPARAEDAPVLGQGTLMISTKPPCGIIIDGKPTGLTTPQTSISLPAGTHNITLVNGESGIQKAVSVQIAPNATQKVILDLME